MSRVSSAYPVVKRNVFYGGELKRIFDGDQKSGREGASEH